MINRLLSFIFIIFFTVFVFCLGFLFFTRQVYERVTLEDVNNLGSYIANNYSYCCEEDFLKEIWLKRPSLLDLSLQGNGDILIHSYRKDSFSFFKRTFVVPVELGTGQKAQLTLIYTLLPKSELLYCCSVSLVVLLSLLFLFFSFIWRIF